MTIDFRCLIISETDNHSTEFVLELQCGRDLGYENLGNSVTGIENLTDVDAEDAAGRLKL